MSASITIQGNLSRKPELKISSDGLVTANLSVAVNRRSERGGETVSYFSVVAFGDLATNACETLERGSRVVVSGRLDQRVFESAAGEKRSVFEVVAYDIGASLKWASGSLRKSVRRDEVQIDLPPLPAPLLVG